ncbi:MAG: triacylglycerol lipase [Candidatus Omnitrophota bacterium]|jgi:triacylglycerol lipase
MATFKFIPNTTRFNLTNAMALSEAAGLAYQEPAQIKDVVLNQWGMTHCECFEKEDTQAFIAANDKVIIVSYRGTESKEDWMTDAKCKLIPYKQGRAHFGFNKTFKFSAKWLKDTVNKFDNGKQTLWVTGHSLGAALATLAVDFLLDKENMFAVNGLYMFGSPRVGDKYFAENFDKNFKFRTFRFVNDEDIVTRVPLRSMGYKHIGTVRYIDCHGDLHCNNVKWKRWISKAKSVAARSLDGYAQLKGQYPNSIADHSMSLYIKHVKANCKPKETVAINNFQDYMKNI